MQITSIVSGDVCLQTRPELIKLSRNVNRLFCLDESAKELTKSNFQTGKIMKTGITGFFGFMIC